MSEIENMLETVEWVPWARQAPPMKKEPSNKDLRSMAMAADAAAAASAAEHAAKARVKCARGQRGGALLTPPRYVYVSLTSRAHVSSLADAAALSPPPPPASLPAPPSSPPAAKGTTRLAQSKKSRIFASPDLGA